jgi:predicted NodU family carbamoyl transferase
MKILGISAFYHDSAAAIIQDGEVIAAAQEERFSRIKNDPGFPAEAIHFCLKYAGKIAGDLLCFCACRIMVLSAIHARMDQREAFPETNT